MIMSLTPAIRRARAPAAEISNVTQLRDAAAGDAAEQASPGSSERYVEHLKSINATFYDQVKFVDQKAAYVFTFLVAMTIWSQDVKAHFAQVTEPAADFSWLLSVCLSGSLVVSAISAILVVVPRNRRGGNALYWGAWPEAGARLAAGRSMADLGPIADDYEANVRNLAAICREKYRMARLSYLGLMGAVISYLLAITIG